MEALLDNMVLCFCACATWLDIAMVVTLVILLMAGYPAAFSLAGTALIYGLLGFAMGAFDTAFFTEPFPIRIFGIINNQVLIAVPLFVLMGVVLERAKIAEELLDNMAQLFGSLNGGLGISVTIVGALLAASTGIVGATVVTMGLLSLPTMLRRGYDPGFASGSIAAAGTLGQIIPPSIVLILLGDQISNAWQKAQLAQGVYAPKTVSVGDLFAGALIPGLMLVGMYLVWQIIVAVVTPKKAPAIPAEDRGAYKEALGRALKTLPPPLLLIVAVLGSILAGVATPTEAAGVGAVGAMLIAGHRLAPAKGFFGKPLILAGALAIILLVILTNGVDMRLGRESATGIENAAIVLALISCVVLAVSTLASPLPPDGRQGADLHRRKICLCHHHGLYHPDRGRPVLSRFSGPWRRRDRSSCARRRARRCCRECHPRDAGDVYSRLLPRLYRDYAGGCAAGRPGAPDDGA